MVKPVLAKSVMMWTNSDIAKGRVSWNHLSVSFAEFIARALKQRTHPSPTIPLLEIYSLEVMRCLNQVFGTDIHY